MWRRSHRPLLRFSASCQLPVAIPTRPSTTRLPAHGLSLFYLSRSRPVSACCRPALFSFACSDQSHFQAALQHDLSPADPRWRRPPERRRAPAADPDTQTQLAFCAKYTPRARVERSRCVHGHTCIHTCRATCAPRASDRGEGKRDVRPESPVCLL